VPIQNQGNDLSIAQTERTEMITDPDDTNPVAALLKP